MMVGGCSGGGSFSGRSSSSSITTSASSGSEYSVLTRARILWRSPLRIAARSASITPSRSMTPLRSLRYSSKSSGSSPSLTRKLLKSCRTVAIATPSRLPRWLLTFSPVSKSCQHFGPPDRAPLTRSSGRPAHVEPGPERVVRQRLLRVVDQRVERVHRRLGDVLDRLLDRGERRGGPSGR